MPETLIKYPSCFIENNCISEFDFSVSMRNKRFNSTLYEGYQEVVREVDFVNLLIKPVMTFVDNCFAEFYVVPISTSSPSCKIVLPLGTIFSLLRLITRINALLLTFMSLMAPPFHGWESFIVSLLRAIADSCW